MVDVKMSEETEIRLKKVMSSIEKLCTEHQAGITLQAEQMNGGIFVKMVVVDNKPETKPETSTLEKLSKK